MGTHYEHNWINTQPETTVRLEHNNAKVFFHCPQCGMDVMFKEWDKLNTPCLTPLESAIKRSINHEHRSETLVKTNHNNTISP
jgi:hypothetical protein